MRYRVLPVTPFQQNCSLVWCEDTLLGALIDPGGEPDRLLEAAAREGVKLEKLLLTHGHVDHVGAAGILAERLGVPVIGPHREDAFLLDGLPQQCAMFGFPHVDPFLPQQWLEAGDSVEVGKVKFRVLLCPGHTPGHVVFFQPEAGMAFVGDVLFRGSIGRTDFPRGDYETLIRSIRHNLFSLGDQVRFVPGHGPMSSIGQERLDNPFLTDLD